MEFLIESWVSSPIGAGAGAELGGGVLEHDVGVLAGEELRVPQLPAPGDSDFQDQPVD
jgi:hypothetical protein